MPVHDWTRVEDGVFHNFHFMWTAEINRALNEGLLPQGYYSMAEQRSAGFEADVLTLRSRGASDGLTGAGFSPDEGGDLGVVVAPPRVSHRAETDREYYLRKRNVVTVRHVSGDDLVAVIEIVSPGNKSARKPMDDFVNKALELISRRIHLLIVDLQPPTVRDPQGIHGRIWDDLCGEAYLAPSGKPLTLAAYESDLATRAYVEPVAVGDVLIDMPLYLWPGGHVPIPLERTYEAAWRAVPRRWREVVEREA